MRIEIRSGEGGDDAAKFAKELGGAVEAMARRTSTNLTQVAPGVYEVGPGLR